MLLHHHQRLAVVLTEPHRLAMVLLHQLLILMEVEAHLGHQKMIIEVDVAKKIDTQIE